MAICGQIGPPTNPPTNPHFSPVFCYESASCPLDFVVLRNSILNVSPIRFRLNRLYSLPANNLRPLATKLVRNPG